VTTAWYGSRPLIQCLGSKADPRPLIQCLGSNALDPTQRRLPFLEQWIQGLGPRASGPRPWIRFVEVVAAGGYRCRLSRIEGPGPTSGGYRGSRAVTTAFISTALLCGHKAVTTARAYRCAVTTARVYRFACGHKAVTTAWVYRFACGDNRQGTVTVARSLLRSLMFRLSVDLPLKVKVQFRRSCKPL